MNITERQKQILKAVVECYIDTAEPVGSKAVSALPDLTISPATIRNEMAELTSMGLLEQAHTSAGRTPTSAGYRVYVNELMNYHRLSVAETEEINRAMRVKMQQLDKVISDAGRLVSDLTSYPTYALSANLAPVTIRRFDLITVDDRTLLAVAMLSDSTAKNKVMSLARPVDEGFLQKLAAVFNANFTNRPLEELDQTLIASAERATGDVYGLVAALAGFAIHVLSDTTQRRAVVTGTSHILEHPEYRDIDKAKQLMNYLSDDERIMSLPTPDSGSDVKILIGSENVADELKDSSVVVAKYELGGGVQGLLGVVGPTRMDYAKVAANLTYIARSMKDIANGGAPQFPVLGAEPGKDDK